jgi:hypothetical protein
MDLKINQKILFGISIGICILIFFCLNWGNSVPLIKNNTDSRNPALVSFNRTITLSTEIQKINNVSISRAIGVVANFSSYPNLIVSDIQMVNESDGCNGIMRVYNITTNEGIYQINSNNYQLISVAYNTSLAKPLTKSLELHQIVEISQSFLQEKFGNYSSNLSIPDSDAHELFDQYHYQIIFPDPCPWISLTVDKNTGQVTEYINWVAGPAGCVCWREGDCETVSNSC